MGYHHEGTATTTASPTEIWRLWSDVGSWHCWEPSVQQVALEGHFAQGAGGTIVLAGGVEAPFVLEVVEPCARFLDRLTMGDLVVRIDHEVRRAGSGSEITIRTMVDGPGAEGAGPMVAEDTPKALEALVAMAEQKATDKIR